MLKILFFAPHSAIWVHAFPEALIAEALGQHGHRIVYVTCGGEFARFCVPMSAHGLTVESSESERLKLCSLCCCARDVLRSGFGFDGYNLSEKLDTADRERADTLVAATTKENMLDLRVHGIEVGRLALYELLLTLKKRNLEFSDAEWQAYRVDLRNALCSLFAATRILDEERPDRVVMYNSLYGVNHVVYRLAESRGIPTYFLHAGGNQSRRLETLMLGRGDGVRFYHELLARWRDIRGIPCDTELLAPVTDHFIELLRARSVFVYSAPRSGTLEDLRARFGIGTQQRVLVATMSSLDERFASETIGALRPADDSVFPSQVEWVQALLSFVRGRPDLFLMIRVHPREFPNRREAVKSEHARQLEQAFTELPSNATVNWPTDDVSLYDLADVADVFLNAWSSAGKEMSLLGLPVVVFSAEQQFYAPDLNYVGTSEADYFAQIGRALADGWSVERIRTTYRWYALEYERSLIDIRESFPQSVARTGARARRLADRFLRRAGRDAAWRADCLFRRRRLRAAALINQVITEARDSLLDVSDFGSTAVPLEEETRALRAEVNRLIRALYASRTQASDASPLRQRLQAFATGA